MRKFILLLVPVIFCYGCSGLFHSRKPLDPNVAPASVYADVHRNVEKVKTLSGRGLLTVSSAEGSYRTSIQVRIKQPDSLWFKIEGPLGLDFATGRLSGEEAEIFVGLDNTLYTGPVNRLSELNLLPVDLELSGLILLFLGLADPVRLELDDVSGIEIDGNTYRFQCGPLDVLYIDPGINAVTNWEKIGLDSTLLAKFETGEYRKIGNIYLPRLIKMTGYYPRQRMTIFYERLDPNITFKDNWFEIKIPEGVNIVNL